MNIIPRPNLFGALRISLANLCIASAILVLSAVVTGSGYVQAASIVSTGEMNISVDVNKGSLVKLDSAAASVFVADPEIADVQVKSPTLIYVFGKKPGNTTLYAVAGDDTVLFSGNVQVSHNLNLVKSALGSIVRESNLDIKDYNGMLILTGKVKSALDAENARSIAQKLVGKDHEVVNRLEILSPVQVNLRVRVAEVARDISKQLGFNWESSFNGAKGSIGILNSADVFELVPSPFLENPVTGLPLPVKEFFVGNQGAGSYFGGLSAGKFDINGVIDALETEGFLTVLAEPNLTAMSGETAYFLAGGEFPIPVPQDDSRTITVSYKEFGVSLSFTPTVMSDNQINLKVQPEVSQLSSSGGITLNGFAIPSLTTRRAATTVELGSGQSFAVAGLLQNNIERDLSKFPGLGDLPILGALFRSDRFRRQETELLIIVTPYIVQPVSGKKIPLPTDGLIAPNEVERLLHGQSYSAHAPEAAPVMQGKKGTAPAAPAGFILN